MSRLPACCLAAAVLAGCVSLAPHYQRPAQPTPATWPTGAAYPPAAAEAAPIRR